jgi:hypothetical protein
MVRRVDPIVFGALLILAPVLGCAPPSYSTQNAETCSNGHIDSGETDVDCGGNCAPCSSGDICQSDGDCSSGTCLNQRCYDSSCHDGRKDNDETDVDCGGKSCPVCGTGKKCSQSSDCGAEERCVANSCYPKACADTNKDGNETDVDCGGDTCPPCAESLGCHSDADCAGGNSCIGDICYNATCHNSKKDGTETDVDCGGAKCPACAALKSCIQSSDCKAGSLCMDNATNGVCTDATSSCLPNGGTCYVSACSNGNVDSPETDVDCGGSVCPGCSAGKQCIQNTDCNKGNVCIDGTCYIDTCKNLKQDSAETDKDCGGKQCPPCAKGLSCNQASDCVNGVPCTNGKCGDPQCFDKTIDGSETDVDCGGTCGGCDLTKTCASPSDCLTLNCSIPSGAKTGTCAAPTCSDGSKDQGESDIDCGDPNNLCPRCGTNKVCTDNSNCASSHCVQGFCVAATCEDGILNGNETARDCGGGCKACPDDSACSQPTDCTSGVCTKNVSNVTVCQKPTCNDGVKNGDETGKDCGGPTCTTLTKPQLCPNNEGCAKNSDCAFNNCSNNTCQLPTCANNVWDQGSETDVDCGGSCPPCADKLGCVTAADCQSKVCNTAIAATYSAGTCAVPTCLDTVQNGNETDKDCGGVTCTARCADGKRCATDSDCVSKVCDSTGTCAVPTCNDSAQNGNETGLNCGGSCAPVKRCGTGVGCNVDGDCASNNCCTAASCGTSLNKCVAASCTDGKTNQDETGIDCGGNTCTKRCGPNQPCLSKADCDSGVCSNSVCQAPTCTDTVKNGNESDIDCGTACPKLCEDGKTCVGPGDCVSGVCKSATTGAPKTCAVPTCTDGIKNGNESCSADHGGGCPDKCPQGSTCNLKSDCDATVANIDCIKNVCSVPSCKDGSIDGDETDVDCGGSCGPCGDAKVCKVNGDCTSKHCAADSGGLHCAPASCSDTLINQGESGTDCGGTSPCAKCGTGLGCTQKTDCINGVCDSSTSKCAAPTCSDTVQNQQETDLDCGGPNCRTSLSACDNGKACLVGADCKEQWCVISGTTGVCTHPTCTDTQQNGTETDVDCGGTCQTKCLDTKKCSTDADCSNGWCNGGTCATPACTDAVQNGTETGKDCGGNCAATCQTKYDATCLQCTDGAGCNVALDCKSLTCTNNKCATPTNCIAKALDGLAPSGCAVCNSSNKPVCLEYLLCYFLNSCNPVTGKDANGTVCAGSDGGGVCGHNKIGGGTEPENAAIATYRCAGCPLT